MLNKTKWSDVCFKNVFHVKIMGIRTGIGDPKERKRTCKGSLYGFLVVVVVVVVVACLF